MDKWRVAQVGCGGRGKIHLDGWLGNPDRFEVLALCELDEAKMKEAAAARHVAPAFYADADAMLAETRPDVFCFSTQPDVRLSMVELAARHHVKGLVFEKPMATSIREARAIVRICRENGIKAAVSHQHKYLTSFRQLKAILDAGSLGAIERIQASCQAWLAQLGTHFVDYVLWANGGQRAVWVVGHVHGRERLSDSHPSPDFTLGLIKFENGVYANVEFGKQAASHMDEAHFWVDDRLTVYGDRGYAWAETDGRWQACTGASQGRMVGEQGPCWIEQEKTRLQPLFARDLADWLDDDGKPHPCNLDITYHGYEIMEALCLSALDHARVDLPLDTAYSEDILERLRRELGGHPGV